jgi:hypothetical protein
VQRACNGAADDERVLITRESVRRRSPLHGSAEAFSGATLERVELSDGRRFVLKHLPADGDWLTRASGRGDRLQQLWVSGVLGHVGTVVDHAVVDIFEEDGHDVVVMRDMTEYLLAVPTPVARPTSRRLLAGLIALHDLGRVLEPQPLCSVDARYQMFAPSLHAPTDQPGTHPARDLILTGWTLFAEVAPPEVVDAVFAVHDGTVCLSERLRERPTTLLHGDAKLANLGRGPNGLIAIDWGDLTGFGPPEVDAAWYALMNEPRLGLTTCGRPWFSSTALPTRALRSRRSPRWTRSRQRGSMTCRTRRCLRGWCRSPTPHRGRRPTPCPAWRSNRYRTRRREQVPHR